MTSHLTIGLASFILASGAGAATINVYSGQSIQDAISAASPGDEILVHPGSYLGSINLMGQAITLRSTDGPDVTILDGGLAGSVITCASGEGPDTVVEGFTVTNGTGTEDEGFTYGGGMYNVGSSPTLANCVFVGNSARYGGGMSNELSSPTLTNCSFNGNLAFSRGGGMYSGGGSPTLTDCEFSGNSADSYGGGMCNEYDCYPTLTDCTFSGNTAVRSGGGMNNWQNSRASLTNCTFNGNSAEWAGGGIVNFHSNPTLANCTFSGNSVAIDGGGMMNFNSSPRLTNCTFSGNSAYAGGGIYSNASSSARLTNCIVWGNAATYAPQIQHPGGDLTTVVYSCIGGGWPGSSNTSQDPQFVDADGPDDIVGTVDDDLRLEAGSRCIDAGLSVTIPEDLDGNRRIVDAPAEPDRGLGFPEVIDMGAYEFGSTPPGPNSADIDRDGDVDLDDFMLFQQQFSGPQP